MPTRVFQNDTSKGGKNALIIGITGPSSSGKTFSALRLAKGIQTVLNGKTYGIDTEAGRMGHYKSIFDFTRIALDPPHGPLDYLGAIEHCVKEKAKVIVIDTMTHEHSGDGGVLDQIEKFLDEKCGEDWGKRNSMNMVAQVRPKAQRKVLNRRIVQLSDIIFILCYRAAEKVKPKKKTQASPEGGMEILGWQADTTSPLIYDMTARFLLLPGCDGKPTFAPDTTAEKLAVKNPWQFRGWFSEGLQLNEELGAKMAKWHLGEAPAPALPQASQAAPAPAAQAPAAPAAPATPIVRAMESKFNACKTLPEWDAVNEEFNVAKGELTAPERLRIIDLKTQVRTKLGGS